MSKIRVDLTMGQITPVGDFMGKLMYSSHPLKDLVNYSGCPHNGGEHSFCINDDEVTALTWLDLLIETVQNTGGAYALTPNKSKAFDLLKAFTAHVKEVTSTTSKRSFSLKKYCLDNGLGY